MASPAMTSSSSISLREEREDVMIHVCQTLLFCVPPCVCPLCTAWWLEPAVSCFPSSVKGPFYFRVHVLQSDLVNYCITKYGYRKRRNFCGRNIL